MIRPLPLAASVLALLLAAPLLATANEEVEAEIAELEAVLERVEAALAKLTPIVAPPIRIEQYDVRQLLFRPDDRDAPGLGVVGQDAGYRTATGAGSFSFEETDDEYGLSADALVSLLELELGRSSSDERTWFELYGGFLFAGETDLGHARIRRLLDGLTRDRTRAVQLEVGLYALPPELHRAVELAGQELDGVLPPELLARLDRAVAAGEASLSAAAMVTGLSEQRVFLHQGDERTYVGSYELSAGGTGTSVATVADPLVEVLRSGLGLDVRATLIGDEEPSVHLDVRFARARLIEVAQRATPWGAIDAPRVVQDAVRTSARVPPGAGVLVFDLRGVEGEGRSDLTIVVRPRVVGR